MIPYLLIAAGAYLLSDAKARRLKNGGRLPSLDDIAEVKINFPDADFWLQRKGSEKTIGKPKRDFYEENIGIKVRPEFRGVVSPSFLYYSLEYLYQQKAFENLAIGSLGLKNLRIADVKKLPIQFGIKK